jgi:hypothetical protein
MFLDLVTEMLPFLTLGALGSATLSVAVGSLRSARRSEPLGEDRFESYCATRLSDWSCCAKKDGR